MCVNKLLVVVAMAVCFGGSVAGKICAFPCDCHSTPSSLSVLCSRKNLSTVPRHIPPDVTDLDLSQNSFPRVHRRTFPHLPTLRSIDMQGCGIQRLDGDAFRNLPALGEILLNHNKISSLADLDLGYLDHSLHSLSLDHNLLESMTAPLLSGLHLHTLSLQDNGRLSFLAPHVFHNASVETLSLDRCNLATISTDTLTPLIQSLHNLMWSYSVHKLTLHKDTFASFNFIMLNLIQDGLCSLEFLRANMSVQSLDVSHNPLRIVDLAGYVGLHKTETLVMKDCDISQLTTSSLRGNRLATIHQLDISLNKLSSLNHQVFQQMFGLRRLNLTSNRLTSLSLHLLPTFSRLETLDMYNVKFDCDCRLEWFRRWMQASHVPVMGAQCKDGHLSLSTPLLCTPPMILALDAVTNSSVVSLSCMASGTPAPAVYWLYTDGDAIPYPPRHTSNRTVTASVVRVPDVAHCVSVQCVAENTRGTDYRTLHACVQDAGLAAPSASVGSTIGWTVGGLLILTMIAGVFIALFRCDLIHQRNKPFNGVAKRARVCSSRSSLILEDDEDVTFVLS